MKWNNWWTDSFSNDNGPWKYTITMDTAYKPVKSIYLIGSLRNPEVPVLAKTLRKVGFDVFDDWYAAGPEADDYWQKYEKERGHTYAEALDGYAANHVFEYDHSHLNRCDAGVLLLPAGKSGHLEAGYILGQDKPLWIVMPEGEPDRFDVMYRFATKVCMSSKELLKEIHAFNKSV